jgi:hypothetical protein
VGGLEKAQATLPRVDGATTTVYATNVLHPHQLAFAADGTLFVGRDPDGGATAVRIWQIAPGGWPVTEFGSQGIKDADGLVLDSTGTISGEAGSLLVGSGIEGLLKIAPNGAVSVLIPWSRTFGNPNNLTFDRTDRLLSTGYEPIPPSYDTAIVTLTASAVSKLCDVVGQVSYLVVDSNNRILAYNPATAWTELYSSNGNLLNAQFIQGLAAAVGKGAFWGEDVYALDTHGELLRVDLAGETTPVGWGFTNSYYMEFGNDGSLYVAVFEAHQILKITPDQGPRMTIRVSEVEVCWTSVTNATYRVEYRSHLTTNTWVTLSNCVASAGTETCIYDKVLRWQPQRFYRAVVTNCVAGF